MNLRRILFVVIAVVALPAAASERPEASFQIFQFPPDKIPCVDGKTDDWAIVPESYVIGMDQLADDSNKHPKPDAKNLDVKVRVGWVKGMNRLYFLYEAYDDYWDFALPSLHNDTFELVVDGDMSGGPLIDRMHPLKTIDKWDAYFSMHGVHAQNYHIFTPAEGKDWCMAWGCQPWIKELPYANAVCKYDFKPGQAGKLVLEFWITPFDYAGAEGPSRAVESVLREGKNIGMSWAVIDYDDEKESNNGFWNLSRKHTMYGNASELCSFKLMPLEPQFKKGIDARWMFKVLDMDRRLVAFEDASQGKITTWKWDFGDGTTSAEQHPLHTYKDAGLYIVTLYIEGPEGKSRMCKVWDVAIR